MSKMTNGTLANAIRSNMQRLRQGALAGDIERVKGTLYSISTGIALLPRKEREALTSEMRALMRELDASAPAVIRGTIQVALSW